ncbi:hypothetical protein FRC17_009260 [Serendipita sp. 399]|nr:hypothetical protein FRC17_009260 [Serendipita sp. 399]
MGHDDEELSKDSEKNTILCLLADIKGTSSSGPNHSSTVDTHGAALRMAKLYRDRFPFLIDWSNQHGKTPLHNAALRGNDDFMLCDLGADIQLADLQGNTALHYASAWGHIPCVVTLIERGCDFNAKNNDGFTPSDYAYSNNTLDALQDTARNMFEVNKYTRAVAQQQARRAERSAYGYTDSGDLPRRNHGMYGMRRLRSGSATTSASDSTDYEGAMSGSAPGSSQMSGQSSSGSLPRPPPSNGTILTPISASNYVNRARNTSNSSSHAPSHMSRPSVSSTTTNSRGMSNPSGTTLSIKSSSTALSPVASRMLERDAGAMAEYRVRSGSHSSTTGEVNGSLLPSSNLSAENAPTTPISPLPELPTTDFRTRTIPRSLRPSLSAASLRQSPMPSIMGIASGSNPRIRAGTMNHVPGSSGVNTPKTPPMASSILQTLKRPVMAVLPGVRGSDHVTHIDGHSRRPSGSLLRDIRTDTM